MKVGDVVEWVCYGVKVQGTIVYINGDRCTVEYSTLCELHCDIKNFTLVKSNEAADK